MKFGVARSPSFWHNIVEEVSVVLLCDLDTSFVRVVAVSVAILAICSGCSPKGKDAEEGKLEGSQNGEVDLLSLASVQIPGWHEEKTTLIGDEKGLAKYVSGRAELYCAYGFRRLAIGRYKNEKSLPMLVEIYEFDSSENAYGMYSFDTTGEKLELGQGAVYGYGLLKFWKGKLLVRVHAEEEHLELEEEILAFGRRIDSGIPTEGPRPDLLFLVTEEKLVPDSLHFFHLNICLNNIYYIPESIALTLSDQVDVVTAQYMMEAEQPSRLFLIEYPDEPTARTAFEKFGELYFRGESMSADRQMNIIRMAEKEYSSMTLSGNLAILIFEAPSPGVCRKLLAGTLARIELYGEGR